MSDALPTPPTVLERLAADIRRLRLAVLPQLRFMMALERVRELLQALEAAIQAVCSDKTARAPAARLARAAAAPLLARLAALEGEVAAAFAAAEARLPYNAFQQELRGLGRNLREVAAKPVAAAGTGGSQAGPPDLDQGLEALRRQTDALQTAWRDLDAWAAPRTQAACAALDQAFALLETTGELAEVRRLAQGRLTEAANERVAASGLFAPPGATGQAGPADPLFDDAHYAAAYPETRQLRYAPKEHFVRYGELFLHDPSPDFDTRYYLESNEDVLEANIPAFRHFALHGLAEGRPPRAKAGRFFAARYLEMRPIRLAFLDADAETDNLAWNVLRAHCAGRAGCRLAELASNAWDGDVSCFDVLVAGDAGAARLGTAELDALARGRRQLLHVGDDPARALASILDGAALPLDAVRAVTANYTNYLRWQEGHAPLRLHYAPWDDPRDAAPFLDALLDQLASGDAPPPRRIVPAPDDPDRPCISVVSIIYRKAREMLLFLESLNRQDIGRPYEVILVNDASPDDAEDQVRRWLADKAAAGRLNRHMRVRLLANAANSGNCVSRNRGVAAAAADIVLVADGDVVLGASSLGEHVWAYRCGDCDAVIGFSLFDMNQEIAADWLAACEAHPAIVRKRLAQPVLPSLTCIRAPLNSLYNCITRNASFQKSACGQPCFDEDFGYSSAPDSGYGHEDFELGARLYFAGKNVRYLESSVAVHMRHADKSQAASRTLAALRNWNRLLRKHPDLPLVDRQHWQWRTRKLLHSAAGLDDAPEVREARERFASQSRLQVAIRPLRPLNILTYVWDVPYQHELFKLHHHQFTLAVPPGAPAAGQWDLGQRPLPRNVGFLPLADIDPRDYDFAILPCDSRAVAADGETDLPREQKALFLALLEATAGMARAAVCLDAPPSPEDGGQARTKALGGLLADIHVVCSSHQARQEWGFAGASVIWPGVSPLELPPGTHAKACLTLPPRPCRTASDRAAETAIVRLDHLLGERGSITRFAPPQPPAGYRPDTPEWSVAAYQRRVRAIGEYAVYVSPAMHAPMPLDRAQAMVVGTIPVTLRNHDVAMFIQNGDNGFHAECVEEMAEQIAWLLAHAPRREAMARRARATASDILGVDRFLAAWANVIAKGL